MLDVESLAAEQPGEGAGGEVGAVFVVDVPERALAQHAERVRDFEPDAGAVPLADRLPHGPHERAGVRDVLQRVPAADEVGLDLGIRGRVGVANE